MVNSQEEIINDRTSASVSSLAYNVSSSMSDSDVRLMLQQYWEGDFLAWCDSSVANLPVEHVKRVLADTNLILDEQGFDSFAKAHSEITQIPFLLLKTALADRLCREFLADPFFLLQQTAGRELLGVLNASFECKRVKLAYDCEFQEFQSLALTIWKPRTPRKPAIGEWKLSSFWQRRTETRPSIKVSPRPFAPISSR